MGNGGGSRSYAQPLAFIAVVITFSEEKSLTLNFRHKGDIFIQYNMEEKIHLVGNKQHGGWETTL